MLADKLNQHLSIKTKLVKILLVAVIYYIFARLGLLLALENTNASPVWPPSGFAFAAILMLGYEIWPGIILGAFFANLAVFLHHQVGDLQTVLTLSSAIAIGNTLEALAGYCLIKIMNAGHILDKAENFAKFFLVSLLMCVVSCTIGTNTLFLTKIVSSENYANVWFTWWLGDFTGIITLSPILIIWWKKPEFKWDPQWSVAAIVLFIVLAFYLELVFGEILPIEFKHTYVYLIFIFLICGVFCMNLWQSSVVVLAIAIISIGNTLAGKGPFIENTQNESLLSLQIFISVAAVTTMFLSTTLSERKKAEQNLQEANDNLERKIAERTKAIEKQKEELNQTNTELIRKTVELERSNKELQLFAHVSSHDLQEPLRTVTSFLQLFEQRYKNKIDKEADEFINYAVQGAKRMHSLINDLLAYSRVESTVKAFKKVNLNDVLEIVLQNLDDKVKRNQATITIESHLPILMADYSQMIQLFQNLIDNAIKYKGKQNPEICIRVQAHQKGWLFSISDNGIGINPKYATQIFTLFQRLHSIKYYDGTGIGLALCKKIVERHGGEIWVESELEKGAVFYFILSS